MRKDCLRGFPGSTWERTDRTGQLRDVCAETLRKTIYNQEEESQIEQGIREQWGGAPEQAREATKTAKKLRD